MLPVVVSKALVAAQAGGVAAGQTVAVGANAVLSGVLVTGGVATMDTQRRIIITSSGDDSTRTVTIFGTNDSGAAMQDTVALTNAGTAVSNLDFRTVTRVRNNGPGTTTTIVIGTNTTGSTQWFMPNYHMAPFELEIDCVVSGTVTFSIEYTMDDFWTPPNQVGVPWPAAGVPVVRPTSVAAATTSQSLRLNIPVRGWRTTITAGTGTLATEAMQSGISNY